MRCAVVDDAGRVVNVIMADPERDQPETGCILVDVPDDARVGPGWTWDGAAFIAPAEPG